MSANYANGAGLLAFVPGRTLTPEPRWYLGLDLGQRRDHSALAAVELCWHHRGRCPVTYANLFQPEAAIRSLNRFPLGTSYEDLFQLVSQSLTRRYQNAELVIDAGGPGPPMVDRLRQTLPNGVNLRPVIITGGKGQNTLTGGYTGIPRRSLLSALLLTIGNHAIICEDSVENWDLFEEELIELNGDNTHPESGKGHDDLVMAVALALNAAIRDTPILLPGSKEREESKFGFVGKRLF